MIEKDYDANENVWVGGAAGACGGGLRGRIEVECADTWNWQRCAKIGWDNNHSWPRGASADSVQRRFGIIACADAGGLPESRAWTRRGDPQGTAADVYAGPGVAQRRPGYRA